MDPSPVVPLPGADGGSPQPDGGEPTSGQSWTVLVYMNADNDLEPFALQDLQEMMAVGSTDRLHIVVEVDRHPGYANGAIGGLANFSDTKRVLVRNGSLQVLQELGERQLDAPAELAQFVQWGLQTFPADRTAIVFWDHGGGWTGFGVDETTGRGQLLTLPEIVQGLQQGLGGRRVALLGFDACLMANYETALSLAPYGDYLLASEEVEPGHGWDWRSLALLAGAPTTSTEALGQQLIADYRLHARKNGQDNPTITLSLTHLAGIGRLEQAVQAFSTAVRAGGGAAVTALARGREQAQAYSPSLDPAQSVHLYDLEDLVLRTAAAASTPAISSARDEVTAAMDAVVRLNLAGSARPGSHGLTVYFPPDATFLQRDGYDALTGAAGWRTFLQDVFAVADTSGGSPGGVPALVYAEARYSLQPGAFDIQAPLDPATEGSVASAMASFGLTDGATHIIFGDAPASIDAGVVSGHWDLQVLALCQGTGCGSFSYGYYALAVEGSYLAMNVAFAYYPDPAGAPDRWAYALRQFVFDMQTWDLVSDTYYVLNGDAFGELTPAPGSTLVPILKVMPAGAPTPTAATVDHVPYMAQGPAFDATQPIEAGFVALTADMLSPGTEVMLRLDVLNAAGEGDYVWARDALPTTGGAP